MHLETEAALLIEPFKALAWHRLEKNHHRAHGGRTEVTNSVSTIGQGVVVEVVWKRAK
jgi:hypothetical protein